MGWVRRLCEQKGGEILQETYTAIETTGNPYNKKKVVIYCIAQVATYCITHVAAIRLHEDLG
jgi:hypothetical protein